MTRDAIRDVLILSREALVASALTELLSSNGTLQVVTSRALLELDASVQLGREYAGLRAPILVYDVASGVSIAAQVIDEFTNLRPEALVIAVIPHDSFDAVPELLDAGVRGIVGRDAGPEELVRAVAEVAAGYAFASRLMLSQMLSRVPRRSDHSRNAGDFRVDLLAPREREVVKLLINGMTNTDIAKSLHLSEATVKAHLGRVMNKWNVRGRLQVALYAVGRIGGKAQ